MHLTVVLMTDQFKSVCDRLAQCKTTMIQYLHNVLISAACLRLVILTHTNI